MKGVVPAVFAISLQLAAPVSAETPEPASKDYQAVLAALVQPLPSGLSCFPEPPEIQMQEPAIRAFLLSQVGNRPPYRVPLDAASGQSMLEMIETAVETAPRPEVFEPRLEGLTAESLVKGFSGGIGDFGLDPDKLIDVAAVHMLAVWSAQQGDFAALGQNGAALAQNVRDQIALAEIRCFHFGRLDQDGAAVRNQMLTEIGFLIDGLETASREGAEDEFGAFVRSTLGGTIEGLTLAPTGFARN